MMTFYPKKKIMTPFDHLKNLHTKKRNWKDFNDEEKKNLKTHKQLKKLGNDNILRKNLGKED